MLSSITNKKFRSLLSLAKEFGVDEATFTRSIRGFFNDGSHRKGENVNWLAVLAMAYPSIDRIDLQFFENVIQVLIFSIAH